MSDETWDSLSRLSTRQAESLSYMSPINPWHVGQPFRAIHQTG
jgi:hypothetical protein